MKVFQGRYNGFLSALRGQQPTVPVVVVTPTWISEEGVTNAVGLTVEDYREEIRDIVAARMLTDPNLHLVEGFDLVPSGAAYFPDGLHPNDPGYSSYAVGLEAVFMSILAGINRGRVSATPRPATVRLVGAGRGGTHGVPELVANAAPVRGTTITVELANPLGRPTAAALLLAPRGYLPVDPGGLLRAFTRARFVAIPAEGARFSLAIPDERCGELLLQAVQLDPGAPGGLAATRLLSLRPGD